MPITFMQGMWIAGLQRQGAVGAFSSYWAEGGTPLEASQNAWALYEQTPFLNSFQPSADVLAKRQDRYFFHTNGTIIVRKGSNGMPWLVTWLPDAKDDPAYPGFSLSDTFSDFPTDDGVAGVLMWATGQPWALRGGSAEPAPEQADRLDVSAERYTELRERVRMDFGVFFAFSNEPDGSFSWALVAENGDVMRQGTEDSWDDTLLAVMSSLYPSSGEK